MVECSFSIKLPKMWATHTFSGSGLEADEVESDSKSERSRGVRGVVLGHRRLSMDLEPVPDEVKVTELVKGPSFVEDPVKAEVRGGLFVGCPAQDSLIIGWKDEVATLDHGAYGAQPSKGLNTSSKHPSQAPGEGDVVAEPCDPKFMHDASHGAHEELQSLAWPSQAALRQSLLDQRRGRGLGCRAPRLAIDPGRLVRFSAARRDGEAPMVQVEYAVKVAKGQHVELRQQLGRAKWRMAAALPKPWNQARLQQQPPGFIKAPSRAPGMDLVDLAERCLSRLTGTRELEDEERMQQLHREAGALAFEASQQPEMA